MFGRPEQEVYLLKVRGIRGLMFFVIISFDQSLRAGERRI